MIDLILIVLLCSVPTTEPQRAMGRLDLSTPRSACITYFRALGDGDDVVLRATMHVAEPRFEPLADAVRQWAAGAHRLRNVSTKRFGRATAEEIVNCVPHALDPGGAAEEMLEILTAVRDDSLQIAGDRAHIDRVEYSVGSELVRVSNQWKVLVGRQPGARNDDKGQLEAEIEYLTMCAKIRDAFAQQLEQGRYNSGEEGISELTRIAADGALTDELLRDRK